MNKFDQNITIAQACGWKREFGGDDEDPEFYWLNPNDPDGNYDDVPNYTGDLNAIHEAEETLSEIQYSAPLGTALFEDRSFSGYICRIQNRDGNVGRFHSATAKQRAEAFLKTLNLWSQD